MIRLLLLNLIIVSKGCTSNINSQTIVDAYCNCETLTSYVTESGNQAFYVTESEIQESENEYYHKKFVLNSIEKIGNQWVLVDEDIISEQFEQGQSIEDCLEDMFVDYKKEDYEYKNIQVINGEKYFYTILSLRNLGRMYDEGYTNLAFIFKNLDKKDKPIILFYERWDGDFSGKYSMESQGQISEFVDFIKVTNDFVDKLFGKSDDDIDSESNFISKWRIKNKDIYDKLRITPEELEELSIKELWFDIEFTIYNNNNLFKEYYYDENETPKFENHRFIIYSGVRGPTFAYDKKDGKTLVIYIPQGYPHTGGVWGMVGFTIKSLTEDVLILENYYEDKLIINLNTQKIKPSN